MSKKKAFSIAEAMMVLLIMSIIVACTMPIITKKAKTKPTKIDSGLWKDYRNEFIRPVDNRDVLLGEKTKEKGIRIDGKLSIKNLEGVEVGWIKDDGSNSFDPIPPGMMMNFVGKDRCPDGWMLADGTEVYTQYGAQNTPDFVSLFSKISGEGPGLSVCVKCAPEQNCVYKTKERRRYYD